MPRSHTIHDQMPWTIERERDDDDYDTFEITVYFNISRYIPARIFGPPEDCYPAEGGNVEDLWAMLDGDNFELTEKERAEITTYLEENYQEDYDDGYYD